MTRAIWSDFICSPERAGRHLSSIGKGVSGAASDPIDLAVLQAFLQKLRDVDDDIGLLANAVDLVTGGYSHFSQKSLPRILDSLSNEVLSHERRVGPGLRGNPRWDRTLLGRLSGTLSPAHYISRLPHRSFELAENYLLSWLVRDIIENIRSIEQRIGTGNLHADIQALKLSSEHASNHHWLASIIAPTKLMPEMILAAQRHRRLEYREAARLALQRMSLQGDDHHAWLYNVMALLAVNWLEPINDDDLFELYVLVLTLDILAVELRFGEPVEYGLVKSNRGYVALFQSDILTIKVYFDQTPAKILSMTTEFSKALAYHRGISGNERRPDILIVVEHGSQKRLIIVEAKRSSDSQYISDSIYKVFGYLHDFGSSGISDLAVKALLVIPTGVGATSGAPTDRPLFLASGNDRDSMITALNGAILG